MDRQQRVKIPQALIIGGGLAGLTTALALQQAGLMVRVFEQAEASREEGAGIALWSNATRVLAHLGCGNLIQSLGAPITHIVRYTPRGSILSEQPLDHLTSRVGIGSFAVHRAEFHRELLQAVAPDTVSLQARCTRFRQDGEGVAVQFADGREAQGDLLIGADGIHSVIRTQLFGQRALRYAGYTTIRGITSFDHPFLRPGKLFETWGRGSQFGAVRLTQGRVYWYLRLTGPAGGARREQAELQALCHNWHEPIEAIIAATEATALVQRDVYDCKPLPQWGQGTITLVGDAAHPMTTSLAQGACQAIEDAGCSVPACKQTRFFQHCATMNKHVCGEQPPWSIWHGRQGSWSSGIILSSPGCVICCSSGPRMHCKSGSPGKFLDSVSLCEAPVFDNEATHTKEYVLCQPNTTKRSYIVSMKRA